MTFDISILPHITSVIYPEKLLYIFNKTLRFILGLSVIIDGVVVFIRNFFSFSQRYLLLPYLVLQVCVPQKPHSLPLRKEGKMKKFMRYYP